VGPAVGRSATGDADERYLAHLLAAGPEGTSLAGLRVWWTAPTVPPRGWPRRPYRPPARMSSRSTPPGRADINENCGSTILDEVRAARRRTRRRPGYPAHDGDADRCLAVDAAGGQVDGDQIMAVLALALRERASWWRTPLVAT